MKHFILYKKFLFLLIAFVATAVHAQDESKGIKSMVETKRFVFKAQSVSPTAMAVRQLTGDNYHVLVSGDSLIANLPYFGRAFTVPAPGASGGFNFTSNDFDYTAKKRRKGGWDVVIKPKDVNDVREFSIMITENGYATLRALSNSRQSITYNGYLAERVR